MTTPAISKVTKTVRQNGTTLVETTVNTTTNEVLPFEVRAIDCVVDFGTGSDMAKTTVTGQPWVTASSRIIPAVNGETDDHDAEDAVLEQIQATVCNLVAGVGFDVLLHAPNRTFGTFNVHCIGV